MSIFLTVLLAGALSANDLTLDYKKCVETFAIGQVQSGEPAETLVRAGEAECLEQVSLIEKAVRTEIQSQTETINAYKNLPKLDVDKLVNEAVADRMAMYLKTSHDAALLNVVFLKARVNEMEND